MCHFNLIIFVCAVQPLKGLETLTLTLASLEDKMHWLNKALELFEANVRHCLQS